MESLTMLINNEKKILVWRPFKNYSSSLLKYLGSYRVFKTDRFISVHGPVPFLENDLNTPNEEPALGHTNWLPEKASSYLKLLPIRNPYDRVVSQWKFSLNFNQIDFDEWLLECSKQLIQLPVSKVYRYDHLIRVEDIENELRKFDLFNEDHEFPHINKSEPVEGFKLTEKQRDMIYYLHYHDFLHGGYDKN